jgi:translation initiation factor IF-2
VDKEKRKTLGLSTDPLKKKPIASDGVRQEVSHVRSKRVNVEVRKKRGKPILASKEQQENAGVSDQEKQMRAEALKRAVLEEERRKAMPKDGTDVSGVKPDKRNDKTSSDSFVPVDDSSVREVVDSVASVSSVKVSKKVKDKKTYHKGHDDDSAELASKRPVHKKSPAREKKQYTEDRTFSSDTVSRSIVGLKKMRSRHKKGQAKNKKTVTISGAMSLDELSKMLGEKKKAIVSALKSFDDVNHEKAGLVGMDYAVFAAETLGHTVVCGDPENPRLDLENAQPVNAHARAPVVVIMGHVDHGKTSLLDALKKSNITEGEAGGITQSIGAYQVFSSTGRAITFIDTPGHQAFSKMRARGANATDIVILVVAADEGINAQTVESINHCKDAGVTMIVALTKIDKPGADPDRVIQQLLNHEIVVEQMGGDVQCVSVSAVTGVGLKDLEEAILLQSDIMELSSDADMRPSGIVLETSSIKGHGFSATVLVQEGTLRPGQFFVTGTSWGRVRFIFDEKGQRIDQGVLSQPVVVIGFPSSALPGDRFFVAESESQAKSLSLQPVASSDEVTSIDPLAFLKQQMQKKEKKMQKIIIKADSQGSVEAMVSEVARIPQDEIVVEIIEKAIGPVVENDAIMAAHSQAIIVQFNVPVLAAAQKIIDDKKVVLVASPIIYTVVDQLRERLSALLDPVYEEEKLGAAKVIQVFHMTGKSSSCIAGCLITDGVLRRGEWINVMRKGDIIHQGKIKSLRHLKDDVKEKGIGYECGVLVDGYSDFAIGDLIHCFERKKIERKL